MNNFTEYKNQLVENAVISRKKTYILPVKFEKIKDKYHMFIMMECSFMRDMLITSDSEYEPEKILEEKLNIIIPISKNDIIIIGKESHIGCIINGDHLNVDMLQYLRKNNDPSIDYTLAWIDMTDITITRISIILSDIIYKLNEKILQGWSFPI